MLRGSEKIVRQSFSLEQAGHVTNLGKCREPTIFTDMKSLSVHFMRFICTQMKLNVY
jgi:hypothetical protein